MHTRSQQTKTQLVAVGGCGQGRLVISYNTTNYLFCKDSIKFVNINYFSTLGV